MKCKLPRVTLAAALWLICCGDSQQAAGQDEPRPGQPLIRQAARSFARQPSLEAKLRQRVTLFEQYLVGSGSYRQLIIGDQKMFRLELVLQIGDTTGSLLQVCTGEVLWEKRDMAQIHSLGYANIQNIKDAIRGAGGGAVDVTQLAIGGLDQLLLGLDEHFEFGDAIPTDVAQLSVWQIRGHWRPEKLPAGSSGETPSGQDLAGGLSLPGHVPHRVTVLLGRAPALPLFPYRVEYERLSATAPKAAAGREYQPIVTLELFDVQPYTSVNAQHFSFARSDIKADDLTQQILERLNVRQQE